MSLVRLNGNGYFVPADRTLPTTFKLSETVRLKVFSSDESERTHFLTTKEAPTAGPGKALKRSLTEKTPDR